VTLPVKVTAEAEEMASAADAWWRENRPAAMELFAGELARALEILAEQPRIGCRYSAYRDREVRRLLLRKTRYHIYYVHRPECEEVVVVAVWSAVKGRPPTLKLP
jgi:plasmid stabilization system protein ParE